MTSPAILVLADGTVFRGTSIGGSASTVGEVVFNTALTGYQEILTDPSYSGQLVTLTCPHIGNVGVNHEDSEASRVFAGGLVIRDLPLHSSSWRREHTLTDYLVAQNIPGIAEIDTRKLTRLLREKGAQSGCLMAGEVDEEEALRRAREFPGMTGLDLAQRVSCAEAYQWTEGEWRVGQGFASVENARHHVVAYDFGVKLDILRMLAQRKARITVVPAKTPAGEVLALRPDGVFLSNGPGDPEPCDYAIKAIQEIVASGTPTFGICLGHQLLGLAAGARTVKMKFGHHGANHPVQDLKTGRVLITSQNHGFAVDANSLPENVATTHVSLFDGSLQGIEYKDRSAFSFQGHPEANPGPRDVAYLFDRFSGLMDNKR